MRAIKQTKAGEDEQSNNSFLKQIYNGGKLLPFT